MRSIPITQARAQLREVIALVQDGEEVMITQHGQPVAVVLRPDRVQVRRAAVAALMERAEKLHARLEEARAAKRPLGEGPPWPPGLAEEWVAEIYAGREEDE